MKPQDNNVLIFAFNFKADSTFLGSSQASTDPVFVLFTDHTGIWIMPSGLLR